MTCRLPLPGEETWQVQPAMRKLDSGDSFFLSRVFVYDLEVSGFGIFVEVLSSMCS